MVGVELLRISAGQNIKRFMCVAFKIGVARRVFGHEPIWCNEIRHEDVAYPVPILVACHRVADLARPKDAFGILIRAVEPRIHGHRAELVSGAHAYASVVGVERLHEHLGDRQAIICQIVVGKSAGLIAVVQENEPPASGGWHPMLGDKVAVSTHQTGPKSMFHCWSKAGSIF